MKIIIFCYQFCNKWIQGRAIVDIARPHSPVPARDISRDIWLWLQLLILAQAVSDHLRLRAVTYENILHSKKTTAQLIPTFLPPDREGPRGPSE